MVVPPARRIVETALGRSGGRSLWLPGLQAMEFWRHSASPELIRSSSWRHDAQEPPKSRTCRHFLCLPGGQQFRLRAGRRHGAG